MASLLMFVSANAIAAEWLRVGSNSESVLYLDYSSIVKKGEWIKAWVMWDFYKGNMIPIYGNSRLSTKTLEYYNCYENTIAVVQIVLYTKHLGGGESFGKQTNYSPVFDEVVPDTVGETMQVAVCNEAKSRKLINP